MTFSLRYQLVCGSLRLRAGGSRQWWLFSQLFISSITTNTITTTTDIIYCLTESQEYSRQQLLTTLLACHHGLTALRSACKYVARTLDKLLQANCYSMVVVLLPPTIITTAVRIVNHALVMLGTMVLPWHGATIFNATVSVLCRSGHNFFGTSNTCFSCMTVWRKNFTWQHLTYLFKNAVDCPWLTDSYLRLSVELLWF